MSMIFYLGYNDKVYLFGDTRVSATINGESFFIRDGFEKIRVYGDKIVFCMGYLPVVEEFFKIIKPDHQVSDIQQLAKTTFMKYQQGELGVYVLTIDKYGRYLLHTMGNQYDFEIMTDTIKNRDIAAAGANSDKALDYACKFLGKMNPFEIIYKAYEHVIDEKVGGQMIVYEYDANDKINPITKKYVRQLEDSRPIRRFNTHATLDGQAKFKKVSITDGNDTVLMDSTTKKFYMNNWDIEGIGSLFGQYIQTGTLTAEDGFINDLTVTALKTLDKSDTIGASVDYVEAKDDYIKFITGTITDRIQAKDAGGNLLYWTDANKTQLTTEPTSYPFYQLEFNPIEKMSIFLEGEGVSSYPKIVLGTGDGVTSLSGKSVIEKPNQKLNIVYHQSNTESMRQIELADIGITIKSEGGKIVIESTNDDIEIRGKNINLSATSNINFNGQQYNYS